MAKSKHAHKVGKNEKKAQKIIQIMKYSACTYKSKIFAQSQQKCVPLHDGETVTFRNSAKTMTIMKEEE